MIVALLPFGFTAVAQDVASAEAEIENYLLKSGDVVEISVLEDSSLNRQVLVRPDGKISMPLAGTIVAEGRTPEALQATIRSALAKDFLEPPTVTVSLVSSSSEVDTEDLQTFYVLGQVAAPGRFQALEPVDVLQALAVAGGPGIFAAKSRIQIRRRDENGGETVTLFDYNAVEEGAGVALQMISDGDIVVVPERGLFE
ncbi:polysaccharide biosynthesis/export family protein [Paralimibaculum aggregatum]|uniref:polysaccharide biosynthesis/export family protein n=1 Tax=Paralimibaculum aggregatum TaxID=3036245 RepID=UPI0025566826|nr:polysaccharide biosynthesis/export family protein [Limibaculum sp. NKW23]